MTWGMVRINVKDYEQWKQQFDGFAAVRREFGSKGGFVLRDVDDANRITVMLEYPDADSFRRIVQDPRMAEAQRRGGVIPPPEVAILEETDRPPI